MIIIAHRGASGYAPENTLKAFEFALGMGAKNFEFDVHLTRDNVLVVHHDYSLKKKAGVYAEIKDLTFSELKKINVACHFDKKSPFQYAPEPAEIIEIIRRKAEFINFEIKNDGNVYPGIEKAVIRFIKLQKNVFKKSVVSSFDYATMKRMRALDADIRLGFLKHKLLGPQITTAIKQAKDLNCESFHINARLASMGIVKKIHQSGLQAYVYTINAKNDALKMMETGADGIFTDFPNILTL